MKLLISKPKMRFYSWQLFAPLISSLIFLMTIVNVQTLDIDRVCPRMLQKVFNGYAPIGIITLFAF